MINFACCWTESINFLINLIITGLGRYKYMREFTIICSRKASSATREPGNSSCISAVLNVIESGKLIMVCCLSRTLARENIATVDICAARRPMH